MSIEDLKKIRKDLAYSISTIESILDRMAFNCKRLSLSEEREYEELVDKSEKNAELIEQIDKIIEKKEKLNRR